MDKFALGRSVGLAVGIVVGLIICVVLFKFWNKDGKVRSKYDEMQEKARGKAYMYSFWTLAGCVTLVSFINGIGIRLFSDYFTANISCILIAALVHASYSVWNDAYMGLNTNYKRYTICMIAVGLINFASGVIGIATGAIIKDGVLQGSFSNLLCAIVFVAIAVELYLKNVRDAKKEED